MKIRNKYIISVAVLIIATAFNFFKVPIQDNYVDIVKWIILGICGGFVAKTASQAFLERNKK